jgi:copper(I)-binding protein
MMNTRFPLAALLTSTALLAACKPATPPAAPAPTSDAAAPAVAETRIGDLLISDASSRETPIAGGTGPGFMIIRNNGSADDRLISASSPATASVEIHEMSMADGQMTMRALPDGLLIPAGGSVELAPGGLHLMLIGVTDALAAGQTVPVELRFEKAGTVTVSLAVKARAIAP